jgi:hypothetical protein
MITDLLGAKDNSFAVEVDVVVEFVQAAFAQRERGGRRRPERSRSQHISNIPS